MMSQERFALVQERLDAISHMLFVAALSFGEAVPEGLNAFILSLRASIHLMRQTNEHGARIGEVQKMLDGLVKASRVEKGTP